VNLVQEITCPFLLSLQSVRLAKEVIETLGLTASLKNQTGHGDEGQKWGDFFENHTFYTQKFFYKSKDTLLG